MAAFAKKDGDLLWQKSGTDGQMVSSNAIDMITYGNYISLGIASKEETGTLYLLDGKSGSIKWKKTTPSTILHTYFAEDDNNLTVISNEGLRFYDLDGDLLWKKDIVFRPAISSEYIAGSSPFWGYYLFKVFDYDGNLIANHPVQDTIRSIEISDDSKLIVVGTQGNSYLDSSTVYYFKQTS